MSDGKFTAIMTVWKAKNPDKLKAQKARWYRRHKERLAAQEKARVAQNREPKRAAVARWKADNPEVFRVLEANRRARLKQAGGKLSKDLTAKLLTLQRGRCACCGDPLGDDFHLDHVMPLALGGSNTDDNMQLLRELCNMRKSAKHPVDFMQSKGFLL